MKTGFGYVIGRRHAAETDPDLRLCQDLAECYSDEDVSIIAVADGKAGRNTPAAAAAAARVNVDTIIAFFRDPAIWRIAEKNDFKARALQMLDSSLETVAGGGEFQYEELRATVSAVAVRSNGEFLAISIGDGTVVAYNKEMQPSVLIAPYREGPKNRTVYTNDMDGADAHMAAWGGTLEQSNFLAFAVFTDGANHLTRSEDGKTILRTAAACTLFGSGDEYITEAIGDIAAEHTRDDVSLAVMVDESDSAFSAAKIALLEAKAAKSAQAEEEPEAEEPAEIEPKFTVVENTPDEPAEDEVPEETPEEETDTDLSDPLPNPPMPQQRPVSEEPTPAETVVLRAVYAKPMDAAELVREGYVRYGRILETTLPLLRSGKICYVDGKFSPNE